MRPDHLRRQAVTITAPGTTKDELNNDVDDWTDPVFTETGLAYLEDSGGVGGFGGSAEDLVDRETYLSDWVGVFSINSQINERCRITHGEHSFEVVGIPRRAFNPRTNRETHIEAHLREVKG